MVVELEIPGIPPNWLNRSMHHMVRYRAKKEWSDLTRQAALKQIGNVLVAQLQGPEKRCVSITFYYAGTPKDHDGAMAAAKPIIDVLQHTITKRLANRKPINISGLRLIWDDTLEWIGKPEINQVRVATRAEQRTVVRVWKEEA